MKYISSAQAARMWGISSRRVSLLASQGRIEGAEFLGNTWLIPENAHKPAAIKKKGRKASEGTGSHNIYPYPLCVIHSEEQLRQLSPEEKELYRVSVLEEQGEYAQAQKCAESLLSSGDRNIRLGALYQLVFSCLYQYDYEAADRYSVLFLSEYYSTDEHSIEHMSLFQCYEMEIGKTTAFLESPDFGDVSSFSPDTILVVAVMKLYKDTIKFAKGGAEPDLCAYELICRQTEELGYYYGAVHFNLILSLLYSMLNRPEAEARHIRNALDIASRHDFVAVVSSFLTVSPGMLEDALCEYPADFAQRVRDVSNIIIKTHAGYTAYQHKQSKQHLYFTLGAEEYRLISYCTRNYTNDKIAELFGLSRAGVNKRLANLYRKLGITSKKEMVRDYLEFVCDWNK